MRRLLSDPVVRARVRERERAAYAASVDRKARKAAADQIRNRQDEQRAKRRERDRQRYATTLHDDPEYIAQRKARGAQWAAENRDVVNAKTAARRAARTHQTPKWLTAEMRKQIQEFYNLARTMSRESGVPHEVDHIVPLQSDVVCGLHVPWNLQVISRSKNRAKANHLGV